jgi:hypothetical protein
MNKLEKEKEEKKKSTFKIENLNKFSRNRIIIK